MRTRSSAFIVFLLFSLCLSGAPVWAAAITNVDTEPKEFEVRSAQGYVPVVLQGGEVWRLPGQVWVRYHGQEISIDDNEEYAFWPGGLLGPQRHLGHGGMRLFEF